jgi:hypothetical protein
VSSQLKTDITLTEKRSNTLSGSCQNVIALLLGVFMGTKVKNRSAQKSVLLSHNKQ